eukprot:gene8557-8739_t
MSLLHKSCSSSLQAAARVPGSRKPFTPAFNGSKRVQQQLVTRAAEQDDAMLQAEAEAAAQDAAIAVEDFEFNYSDAKKGNQWQPSDVEAALEYYQSEGFLQGSSSMPYEQEFVTNPLSAYPGGPEDSSWLADVDNNEAYENDDYALAGIPEAAPKVKRNQREEKDAENEEELRAAEDEKIAAAAFDDVEGLDDGANDNPDAAWNWRLDDGPVLDEEESSSGSAVSGDVSLLNSLANVDLSQHDDLTLEQKDMLSVVLSQVDGSGIDDGLDLIGEELPEASDDIITLSEEETASIEAVLAEADAAEAEAAAVLAEVPSYDLGRELAEAAAYAATGAPVPAAEYEQYLAALKAWDASQVAPADDATVQQLLAGIVHFCLARPVALQDPVFEKFLASAEAAGPDDEAARELMDMVGELQTVSADVDEYNEMVFPADEDLQDVPVGRVGSAVWAAGGAAVGLYYAAASSETDPELVERPEDAPVNMFDDINPELLGADALGIDEDESYERGQFVERILELGRVTKVGCKPSLGDAELLWIE